MINLKEKRMAEHRKAHHSYVTKEAMINRMKRIEGQVEVVDELMKTIGKMSR